MGDHVSTTVRRISRVATIPLLAVALVGAAFGLTLLRAGELDLWARPTPWVVNAIPVALSELYFGHSKRYTSLASVRQRFFDQVSPEAPTRRTINAAIRRVSDMNPSRLGTAYTPLGPDDKGIVDLVELSFLLFGFQLESVLTLYFTLLLISIGIFAVAFWRYPSHLLLLAAFLSMLFLVMPMFTFNAQLRSLVALRVLPVLSMVACLHCLLFVAASLRRRVTVAQVYLVALQVALVTFTIHMRSTTIWQVATIVGFGIVVLVASRFGVLTSPRVTWRSRTLAVGSTVGLVLAGYLALQAYQTLALPEEYRRGDEIATRVFWHNIFSGLALHPAFAERYQLRIDDVSITEATRDYLAEIGRLDIWRDIGGEVPDYKGIKFAKYDPVVRDMLIYRCSTYLRECIDAMLYYKPLSLVGDLAWLYGLRPLPPDLEVVVSRHFGEDGDVVKRQYVAATYLMDERGSRAYLWTPIVLLVIVPFALLLLRESWESSWVALAACVALCFGSTIPIMVGYPLPHTIAEPAITVGMLLYFGVCFMAARWLPSLVPRFKRRRPESEVSPLLPSATQ
jgi:hypothetical protein